jgi:hypothetical protein
MGRGSVARGVLDHGGACEANAAAQRIDFEDAFQELGPAPAHGWSAGQAGTSVREAR